MAEFPDTEDGKRLAVLASLGMISAVVEFDGSGDSGQIEDVSITMVGNVDPKTVPMPEEHRELFEGCDTVTTLHAAITNLADTLLERTGVDWYNNDGGFGEVRIVPGEGSMVVDMNVRVTDSVFSEHDFSVEVERDA